MGVICLLFTRCLQSLWEHTNNITMTNGKIEENLALFSLDASCTTGTVRLHWSTFSLEENMHNLCILMSMLDNILFNWKGFGGKKQQYSFQVVCFYWNAHAVVEIIHVFMCFIWLCPQNVEGFPRRPNMVIGNLVAFLTEIRLSRSS